MVIRFPTRGGVAVIYFAVLNVIRHASHGCHLLRYCRSAGAFETASIVWQLYDHCLTIVLIL